MYDPRAPKMLRNMLLFCAVLAVLGAAVCAAALLRKDRELLLHMAAIFGMLLAVFLIMAALIWTMGRFRVAFSSTDIVYLWGGKAYRTEKYSSVKAITLSGAVDYAWFPIRGADKRQLAILSLLREANAAPQLMPDGVTRFPHGRGGLICCCVLDRMDLETIMNGTQATVFVTEDMMELYAAELKPVFAGFPAERIMVSCRQADSRYPAWRTYREYIGQFIKKNLQE